MNGYTFKRDFKLHFHLPRKNICARYDFFNMKIQTTNYDDSCTNSWYSLEKC